ncbi:MAG: hypothetical protein ACXWUP_09675 [Allosphingosinicella sp.]
MMLLAALTLLAAEVPPRIEFVPPPLPMEVEVVRDAITDDIRAFAILRDRGNRLVVSCEPARYDGARVSFHAQRWLARGNLLTGDRPVIYRFDDMESRRMMWDVDDRHGVMTRDTRVDRFLDEMMVADELVIRTRDSENHLFDMNFRLLDVRPAVEQAMAACADRAAERRESRRRRFWPFGS